MSEEHEPYVTPPRDDATMSAAVDKLATALAKAQAAMKPASKDAKNPHFGSRYSSLAEVWDAIREPLTTNGLAVVQLPGTGPDGVTVVTTLLHTSGQWMRSSIVLPLRPEYSSKSGRELPAGPQQVGSAITYGRRYGICAMVGVASADEDDDGNAASRVHEPPPDSPAKAPPSRGVADPVVAAAAAKAAAVATAAAKAHAAKQRAELAPDKPADDPTSFHSMLYDAMDTDGITAEELNADLRNKGILKGTMTLDNLGEPIVSALLGGKDKASGKPNWEIVVSRIKEQRT